MGGEQREEGEEEERGESGESGEKGYSGEAEERGRMRIECPSCRGKRAMGEVRRR